MFDVRHPHLAPIERRGAAVTDFEIDNCEEESGQLLSSRTVKHHVVKQANLGTFNLEMSLSYRSDALIIVLGWRTLRNQLREVPKVSFATLGLFLS